MNLNFKFLFFIKAYGSGSSLVILSSNFERVQIISVSKTLKVPSDIRCVESTFETGKVLCFDLLEIYLNLILIIF